MGAGNRLQAGRGTAENKRARSGKSRGVGWGGKGVEKKNKAAEQGKGGLGQPQPRSPRTAAAAEASQQHKDKAGPLGSVLRAVCAAGLTVRGAAGGSLRPDLMPSGS